MKQQNHYIIADSNNKIGVTQSLIAHNELTVKLWKTLEANRWTYFGTVGEKKWTSVFSKGGIHLAIHHFVKDRAIREFIPTSCEFSSSDVLLSMGQIEAAMIPLSIESLGMELHVPEQTFTDAWKNEIESSPCGGHYHYQSPKHKFMVWGFHEELDVLLEFYFYMPIPPYGVKDSISYPDWSTLKLYGSRNTPQKTKHIETSMDLFVEPPVLQEQLTDDTIYPSEEAIRIIFEDNDIVIVAYSGGKDSTVCLVLVVRFLLKNPEYQHKFYIVSADTHVENPIIEQHVKAMKNVVVSRLNEQFQDGFAADRFMIVEPPLEEDYVTCVFGKSYAPPSTMYKWCIERIKKDPAEEALNRFIRQANEEAKTKICQILGVRDSESSTRAKSVKKHFEGFYSKHANISGLVTAAPIRHWSGEDVVTYLIRYEAPWGDMYPNRNLVNIYGEASGGMMECPIGAMIGSSNDAVKGCSGSGSRFGCWSCTVVREDTSLRNLVELYPDLEPYYIMRGHLKLAQDIRYGSRTGYQRQRGFAKIGSGIGDLTIDIRTTLLQKWKELNLPMKEEQVLLIDRLVKEREVDEGLALSERFFHALYALLPVKPVFTSSMNHSLWDPAVLLKEDGTRVMMNPGQVDRWTEEDVAYFQRITALRNKTIEKIIKGDKVEIKTKVGRLRGTVVSVQDLTLVLSNISTVDMKPTKKMDSGTLLFSQIEEIELVKAAKLRNNQISIFHIA